MLDPRLLIGAAPRPGQDRGRRVHAQRQRVAAPRLREHGQGDHPRRQRDRSVGVLQPADAGRDDREADQRRGCQRSERCRRAEHGGHGYGAQPELPAPAGVHTVADSCTASGTLPPHAAYTNIGTVTIPGLGQRSVKLLQSAGAGAEAREVGRQDVDRYRGRGDVQLRRDEHRRDHADQYHGHGRATPPYPGDDVTVGTIASLAPGASSTFTRTLTPPIPMCKSVSTCGTLTVEHRSDGKTKFTYLPAKDDRDSYSTWSGWNGTRSYSHKAQMRI